MSKPKVSKVPKSVKTTPKVKKGKATPAGLNMGSKLGNQVTLVSFEVMAVIPTQQYGNIQPKIAVTAPTIDEARALVMPIIEDFYKTYAELPLNGKAPKFYGKVTETEKVVDVETGETISEKKPVVSKAEVVNTSDQTTPPAPEANASSEAPVERSEPFKKAEKAIAAAINEAALDAVVEQIQKSVKINEEEKPALYTLGLKKRKEFAAK